MHRRGVVLLLASLLAVVVVGGGGVRAPWLPANERLAAPTGPSVGGLAGIGRQRVASGGRRMAVGTTGMWLE